MKLPLGAVVLALALCAGCAPARPVAHGLRIVATTSLLASLAERITGDRATVTTLVPVGASPETFEPRSSDLTAVADADVVVTNGAGLESWLDGLLRSVRRSDARIVRCSDGLAVRDGNPHLWLDPRNAAAYARTMAAAFAAADPGGGATYAGNLRTFDFELAALDARIAEQIAALPPQRRAMIVFHDAWRYYNARYGIRMLGVIQERPGREPSAAHLATLADLARANGVHTIFAEPQYDPKLVRVLADTAHVAKIAVLYDDSVGTSPETRDYIHMLDTDTAAIVAGLR